MLNLLLKKNKLFLIEDAAHASGSSHDGKKAGALTDAGAFSFLATKPMTTGGEGGIVTTDNEEIAKRSIEGYREQLGTLIGQIKDNIRYTNAVIDGSRHYKR